MNTRQSYNKNRNSFHRRAKMNAQGPAGSNGPLAGSLYPLSAPNAEGVPSRMASTTSTWDSPYEECRRNKRKMLRSPGGDRRPPSPSMNEEDLPKFLADLIMKMIPGPKGKEWSDAYRQADDLPPITKKSLGELDIQIILFNITLRHDINFDRELSFRPNNDGKSGQRKRKCSEQYWQALVAELELYVLLFQGAPLRIPQHADRSVVLQHAQRRIPKMFEMIHEILKSLVPDRDHGRVDEHLDVQMLMQEIERGVCDMVKLAEWTASLLKEHCAPMRDVWVDEMVDVMRQGAEGNNELIVSSLNKLLGILESMKLDVANHQIRKLKPLLVQDTINFEKQYHLEQIVERRSNVDIELAQNWWAASVANYRNKYTLAPKDITRLQFESFARAVISSLFSPRGPKDLPNTFYLDSGRLGMLWAEIVDMVHFEMCFEMLHQLLKELGYNGTVSDSSKKNLRSSLAAIMENNLGRDPTQNAWLRHSDALSLEIYRQALLIAGRSAVCTHEALQNATYRLQSLFRNMSASYASVLEGCLLSQALSCMEKHYHSSPTVLHDNLVGPPMLPTHSFIPIQYNYDTFPSINTPAETLTDLSNRISHIVILHWRIWAPIAYIQDDLAASDTASMSPQSTSLPSPAQQHPISRPPSAPMCPLTHPPSSIDAEAAQVMSVLKTGEAPEKEVAEESS